MKMISKLSLVPTESILYEFQELAALKATGSNLETWRQEGRDFERGRSLHSFGREGSCDVFLDLIKPYRRSCGNNCPQDCRRILLSSNTKKLLGGIFEFPTEKCSISRYLVFRRFKNAVSANGITKKLIDSPLLEVDLRRRSAIQIVDAHSRRTMVRNCIKSLMKSDANLLASRFLHTLGIIEPRMPIMSALVKEESLFQVKTEKE